MTTPSMVDPPFAAPPDIVLDLPVPPSVNRTRRIDKSALGEIESWHRHADGLTTMAWAGGRRPKTVLDRFEVTIVLSESIAELDLDNSAKLLIDYARRMGLVADDGKRHMRGVHIVWGDAPEGCKLILKPCE